MKTRNLSFVAGVCIATLTFVGCSSTTNSDSIVVPDKSAGPEYTPPTGFPCKGYPSEGTVTPKDLPLPTAATGPDASAKYVTGSVTGPTSWFGGPVGGAPGPLALTQQWDPNGWKKNPGVPYGMEIGNNPCNDSLKPDTYRSYFAAMRFSPREDSPKATAYKVYAPFAQDPRYAAWDGAPLIKEMAEPLSFLYGRKLAVSRTLNGIKRTVIVRAVDRGPTEGMEWSARPVDLSPWAMGALSGIRECIDWNGTNDDKLAQKCDWTGDKATNIVTVTWADNSLPLGPLPSLR